MSPEEITKTKPYKNTGLFADYFLDEILPKEKVWQEALISLETKEIFKSAKELYEKKKENLSKLNEAQTEDEFIRPILDLLGFSYIVQTPAKALGRSLTPDYALFSDEESKKKGYLQVKQNDYSSTLAIADAKYWERPLDQKLKDTRDTLTNQNPTFQISSYLTGTRAKWAILTNGRIWRLYSREYSQTLGEYYQIDLVEILKSGNSEVFLYFYLFFSKQGFEVPVKESFLEQIVRESIEYGAKLQENLKSLIFEKLFKYLAQGFVEWRKQNGIKQENQESLKDVFDNTLILLYRLLFILYAESRDLLPVRERERYFTKSLAKLKQEIKNDIEARKTLSKVSTDYWDDLANLFHIIDQGDPALNVPRYNGGLFSKNHVFLEENKIADLFLTEAIYDLTTYFEPTKNSWVFVDYKTLGVKQLGSIYEGLLEFHLSIADEELAVVKEKDREKYVSVSSILGDQRDTGMRIRPSELYLENTKAERKATGSYYTPEYIVSYIVENTVGPLIDEVESQFLDKIEELKKNPKYKGQTSKWKNIELKNYDPAAKALELKICDPAMGSGHFLVTTVDFIANRIYKLLSKYSGQEHFHSKDYENIYESPLFQQIQDIRHHIVDEMKRQQVAIDKEKLEDDKVIIRRMVMKRCIFGVDLNYLAVELAKLSLWLNSFTVGAPLSFLDHHLRCGNSLIGSTLNDLSAELKKSIITGKMAGLLGATLAMVQVGELTDSTMNELEKSQIGYSKAIDKLQPYKSALDLYTSNCFGNIGASDLLKTGVIDIDEFESSSSKLSQHSKSVVSNAKAISCSKRFFHWELEFPEVFYGATGRKDNSGFDALFGNPPYVNANELNKILSEFEKPFWKNRFASAAGAYDLYVLFIEQSVRLTRNKGLSSLITPNKFLAAPYAVALREYLQKSTTLCRLLNVSRVHVFEDPSVYPVVTIIENKVPSTEYSIVVETPTDKSLSPTKVATQSSLNLSELPDTIWGFLISEYLPLIMKAERCSLALQSYAVVRASSTAAEADAYEDALVNKSGKTSKKFVNTGLIERYANLWGMEPLTHKGKTLATPYIDLSHTSVTEKRRNQYETPKIVVAKMAKRIEAFCDREGEIASANTNFAYDSVFSLGYLLAILNSKVMSILYEGYFGALIMSGGYFQFQAPQLRVLPIRYIFFTTPQSEREKKLSETRLLFKEYLATCNHGEILDFVDKLIKKRHQPDPELVKKHNADPLNNNCQIPAGVPWEQTDVVHDFLAYLAEQMTETNKESQKEISGFLRYFERIIGAEIDSLTNRTLIKNYYEYSFGDLLAVLEKNKNKLKCFDFKSRSDQERLENEFKKSVEKLVPLKVKIQATDNLIDQIVYKLYGLSSEEIQMVEQNTRSGVNRK